MRRASPENPDMDERLPTQRSLYYGGRWHESQAGADSRGRPATGESLGAVVDASPDDVDRAVQAARGVPRVARHARAGRAKAVRRAAQILLDNADELAWLEALDTGNPFQAMRYDVEISVGYMEYFAGLVTEIKATPHRSEHAQLHAARAFRRRRPHRRVQPSASLHGGQVRRAARDGQHARGQARGPDAAVVASHRRALDVFPPGVFNVVTGGRDAGVALVAHPKVAKIGFIGSVPAGRAVMGGAAASLKALTLELGGKNALIACEDATAEEIGDGVVRGMNFRYVTGQSCNSTSRVFLHESIHDAALAEIVKKVAQIKVGLPTERDTEMSCLTSGPQFDKTMSYIRLGVEGGARIAYGGKRPADPKLAKGYFVEPTVFADVTDDMRIAREEIFGPVVSILRWSDEPTCSAASTRSTSA